MWLIGYRSCVPTHIWAFAAGECWFMFSCSSLLFFYCGHFPCVKISLSCFCVLYFFVYFLVVVLSLIACKDSSLKWPVMLCIRWNAKPAPLTHSLLYVREIHGISHVKVILMCWLMTVCCKHIPHTASRIKPNVYGVWSGGGWADLRSRLASPPGVHNVWMTMRRVF